MAQQTSYIKDTFGGDGELIADPDARYKHFFEFYCNMPLLPNCSIQSYMRNSREMLRIAGVYYNEHDYLYAFVIYSRYLNFFLSTIKSHPAYGSCDKQEIAEISKQARQLVFPRTEKLRLFIKEMFAKEAREHKKSLDDEKEAERLRQLEQQQHQIEPRAQLSPELVKHRYDTDNENELNELVNALRKKEAGDASGEGQDCPGELVTATTPSAPPRPHVNRSLKPHTGDAPNNYNMRTVSVPFDLAHRFMEAVDANTVRNVETCGILAGKLSSNKFVLSHCILPKQRGTSDTCITEQEHELFDVIDQANLITLGWIHTHPSQTAFLSSIDLHTHYGYQLMIPEAIAIVCAPNYNEVGTFILTPDCGMTEIAACEQSGFHPHTKTPPLFQECNHAKIDANLSITMIDLRNK